MTIWAFAGRSTAANEIISHRGVAESVEKVVEPFLLGCRAPKVQGGRERDLYGNILRE